MMNILIIDSDYEEAQLFAELLPTDGTSIKLALSEDEALESARAEPPRYVFVEVGRPDLDGYALAKQLRENVDLPESTFISVSEFPQDRAREQSAGIDRHLCRPVQSQDLQSIIPT